MVGDHPRHFLLDRRELWKLYREFVVAGKLWLSEYGSGLGSAQGSRLPDRGSTRMAIAGSGLEEIAPVARSSWTIRSFPSWSIGGGGLAVVQSGSLRSGLVDLWSGGVFWGGCRTMVEVVRPLGWSGRGGVVVVARQKLAWAWLVGWRTLAIFPNNWA
ncbi:hypothetical protein RchiOBHm_Chr7g0236271 [Rosa chinensis]|uniref:Uncharacterized protein n=1 Tax=Rosa chinensis TaxID=74649 RepID=A0A2P6PGW9_ROSCH|nr:hypothetical protein RchiOBHm_Chr7g0236271 [Rosa chinensis]